MFMDDVFFGKLIGLLIDKMKKMYFLFECLIVLRKFVLVLDLDYTFLNSVLVLDLRMDLNWLCNVMCFFDVDVKCVEDVNDLLKCLVFYF